MLEKYIIYRRLREDWKDLGNRKMVTYLNKRMSEMRMSCVGVKNERQTTNR